MGDSVQVAARTGPGENKPGGVARVVSYSGGSYQVKYVMGGSETVDAIFVTAPPEGALGLPRRSRQVKPPDDLAADEQLQEAIKRSILDQKRLAKKKLKRQLLLQQGEEGSRAHGAVLGWTANRSQRCASKRLQRRG